MTERRTFNWALLKRIYRMVIELHPIEHRWLLEHPEIAFWGFLVALALAAIVTSFAGPARTGLEYGHTRHRVRGPGFVVFCEHPVLGLRSDAIRPGQLGPGSDRLVSVLRSPGRPLLRTQRIDQATLPALPTIHPHFGNWRSGLPDSDKSPIFLVAASGGGLLAAYWTASLLAAMDDRTCGRFGEHVFAVAGVFGDSLGLTAYLAQRTIWESKSPTEKCQPGRVKEIQQFLRRDYLGPVAGSLLIAEAVQALIPLTYLEQERGNTLPDSLAHGGRTSFPGRDSGSERSSSQAVAHGVSQLGWAEPSC